MHVSFTQATPTCTLNSPSFTQTWLKPLNMTMLSHASTHIHKNLEKAAGLLFLPKYNETPLTVLQWFWGLNYILVHCFSSMVNNQPAPGLSPLLSLSFLLSTFSPVCIQHILPGCLWSRTHPPHSTCWCPPQGLLWPSPPHPWKDLPKSLKKQQWVKMMCQYIHTPGTKVLFVFKCVFFWFGFKCLC